MKVRCWLPFNIGPLCYNVADLYMVAGSSNRKIFFCLFVILMSLSFLFLYPVLIKSISEIEKTDHIAQMRRLIYSVFAHMTLIYISKNIP